ncbi:hypothetical protein SAMN02745111_02245 [Eubacterium uniforme]|uniref:Uncharacterized protein n=1 Tax=Eubacterium uniforme TaxID=39495 RepID=A0A1T4W3R1_9FIRM|nr:hypothetical protein [Eubacterium uniforme]SKA71705.1 hypothetical protein SAMN02745111_02245 [Eubacterium uniforme]
MELFIKKHNLGLLFGLIVFIICLLFSFQQTFSNKKLTKEAKKIMNDYTKELNDACLSINGSNIDSKKKEILSIIDKYWEDVDDDSSFAKKDANHKTKDDIKKEIESVFNKGMVANVSFAQTNVTCDIAYKYKSNCFDIDCFDESTYQSGSNNDSNESSFITIWGTIPEGDIHDSITNVSFKKIKGSWKIIGIQTDDRNNY